MMILLQERHAGTASLVGTCADLLEEQKGAITNTIELYCSEII